MIFSIGELELAEVGKRGRKRRVRVASAAKSKLRETWIFQISNCGWSASEEREGEGKGSRGQAVIRVKSVSLSYS